VSGSAVSVGVFDGLHIGHQQILARAVAAARRAGGPCVVVSFEPHPDVVLSKTFEPKPPLTPHPERRELLLGFGVDRYEVIPFTRELAALEPETFVERHLMPLGMKHLVVGANFALGRGRSGNVERLRAIGVPLGFDVEPVPLFDIDGAPVSSTRIRAHLAASEVAAAARLLGRRYGLTGLVVTGDGIGRTLGCPTANLRLPYEKCVPGDGIYAVWVRIAGEDVRRRGAMSIGVRPTFGGQVRTLEVHLIDWSGDLVGRNLHVEFVDWLRAEIKFDTPDDLIVAMRQDVADARARLLAHQSA
jgi:riboflavin kinase/FMN adenylyltransferase